MAQESANMEEATITVEGISYPISGLTAATRELLQLYNEAQTAMLTARRQAAIQEISVKALGDMISASVKEGEQNNASADANAA
jgi:uncharacterized protein YoxC